MTEDFLSSRKRLRDILKIRKNKGAPFFEISGEWDDVNCAALKCLPTTRALQIYYQKKTETYVHKLEARNKRLIMKTYEIRDLKRTEAEVVFLRKLANLVIQDVTPHIALIVARCIEVAQPVNKQVIIAEYGDATVTKAASKLNDYEIKVLIFQVLYTLAVIQQRWPSFKHYDLHTSNVLLQNLQPTVRGFTTYTLNDDIVFYHDLKRCPKVALLWDFFFATTDLPPNQYVDVHKFLDSLEYARQAAKMSQELRELLDQAVPTRHKMFSKGEKWRIPTEMVTTPGLLLTHPYFKELRSKPGAGKMSSLANYIV